MNIKNKRLLVLGRGLTLYSSQRVLDFKLWFNGTRLPNPLVSNSFLSSFPTSLFSIFFYEFLQLYKMKKWKRKRIRWEGNFKMSFYSYIK